MTAWILYSLALAALAGAAALAGEAAMRMYRRPTRWVWAAALLVSCAGPVVLAARRPPPSASAAGVPVVVGRGRWCRTRARVRPRSRGGWKRCCRCCGWGLRR